MRLSRLLATSLLASAGMALAQPAASEPDRWISRWDRGECQLIRASGDDERIGLRAPLEGDLSLWVFHPGSRSAPGGAGLQAVIVTQPAAAALRSDRVRRMRRGRDIVYEIVLSADALDAFAAATSVQVDIGTTRIIDLPVSNAAAAIDVLRQCINDQRQEAERRSGR